MKPKLIQQGAEAKIFLNNNWIIKDRISKSYRIPELDKTIRKRRTKSEAKLLQKASEIINSPKPFFIPVASYQIKMPFVKGKKLSEHLDKFSLIKQKQIMKIIGASIAKLHKADIIHGDLTTSNMILVNDSEINNKSINQKEVITSSNKSRDAKRAQIGEAPGWGSDFARQKFQNNNERGHELGGNNFSQKNKIFFIDFGLGFISKKIEDKAVDLHLLKQALEAKHFQHWKELFHEVEKSYEKILGKEESKKVFERITAVEKRGRYRH